MGQAKQRGTFEERRAQAIAARYKPEEAQVQPVAPDERRWRSRSPGEDVALLALATAFSSIGWGSTPRRRFR